MQSSNGRRIPTWTEAFRAAGISEQTLNAVLSNKRTRGTRILDLTPSQRAAPKPSPFPHGAFKPRSSAPPNGTLERREWLTPRLTPIARLANSVRSYGKRRKSTKSKCLVLVGDKAQALVAARPSQGHTSLGF